MQDIAPFNPANAALQTALNQTASTGSTVPAPTSTPTSTTASTAGAASSLAADFDTFLTLLTSQLQNQDPLDPLDTENFTQQLVQFAGVEQAITTNTNLETLIGLQSSVDRFGALSLIGTNIEVADSQIVNDGTGGQWRILLDQPAGDFTADIVDAEGRTVRRLALSETRTDQQVIWDGLDDAGARAPAGVYRLQLTPRDSGPSAAPIPAPAAEIVAVLRVTGIDLSDTETRIETATGNFSLNSIRRITQDTDRGA